MDCQEVADFLEKYHQGDASLRETREVMPHINQCEHCRQTLQRILFDLDLAAFTTFFQENEPPRGFVDKVLADLPGSGRRSTDRKGGARRRPSSSGRMSAVKTDRRGGDRKTGGRKGRVGSSESLKAQRKTTAMRRKEYHKEQSGLFLSDQIFGTQEKKIGLIITYCEECGERIDPEDFESGAAVHYKNASYCSKCKGSVEGFLGDKPETKPGRKPPKTKGPRTKGPTRAQAV
ncbi:MAG: anti-sigma factor family protein, partial [Planctomycetota bacterium]